MTPNPKPAREADRPGSDGPGSDSGDDGIEELRRETPSERADRNFNELLQELRVAQTGVQILFAFQLTLCLQSRFPDIDDFQRVVYVASIVFCACAMAMLIGPVSLHRRLFRTGRKPVLVEVTSRLAKVGLALLLLALVCSLLFVLDIALDRVLALSLTAGVALVFVLVWYVLPILVHRRTSSGVA
jgi:hypothetical protein